MSILHQYLIKVQELLNIKKYLQMWNISSQFYEFGIADTNKNILLGIEFSALALTPKGLVSLLMNKHLYLPQNYLSQIQIQEFSQALISCDQIDQRNLGTIIGMILIGAIGFLAFGFAIAGILGGGFLGLIIGRYAGKRITKTLANKKEVREIDIYEIRVRSYLKWADVLKNKYQYNINLHRFVIEKILSEIKIALHYKYFSIINQQQLQCLLKKVLIFLNQDLYISTIELIQMLLEEYIIILDIFYLADQNIILTQNETQIIEKYQIYRSEIEICLLMGIDNVIKPIVTLFYTQMKENKIPKAIQNAKKFIFSSQILLLSKQYPDPQMSIIYIKMLQHQLNQKVSPKSLKNYVQTQNFKDIEIMGMDIQKQQTDNLTQNISISKKLCVDPIQEDCQIQDNFQVEINVMIEENNESKLIQSEPIRKSKQQINLKLNNHPNKIYFSKINPKSHLSSTPQQSYEDIYQILDVPQQIQYPSHYTEQTIEKFELFRKLINELSESWDLAINTKDAQIYKTYKEGSDTVFIKGYGIIKNVSLEQSLKVVYNTNIRSKWDKLMCDFKVLQQETDDIDIVGYFVQPPIRIITPREWIQRRILKFDFPQKGQITLLFYSVDLPCHPCSKNRIRAITEISTMIFEKSNDNNVKISICSNNDIRGNIPKMIVNRFSASGPIDWFKSLQHACDNFKSS